MKTWFDWVGGVEMPEEPDDRGLSAVEEQDQADVHSGPSPGRPIPEVAPVATLITATCDQPAGFALCERWMRSQTVPLSSLQWIVVDDGIEPTEFTCRQHYIRRDREPNTSGAASLCRNLLAALPHVASDHVLIIEHDDHYKPNHVESLLNMLARLGVVLAGDNRLRYYHVGYRRWCVYRNRGASLSQTGFKRELLPAFEATVRQCLGADQYGIDTLLWSAVKQQALEQSQTVVGIKGLPGRKGLGIGHRDRVTDQWTNDPGLEVLRTWIGADAEVYAPFGVNPSGNVPRLRGRAR